MQTPNHPLQLMVYGAEIRKTPHTYQLVTIQTSRGTISARHFASAGTSNGILMLTGAHGGWTSPAKRLFPRMGRMMALKGFHTLQLAYRKPNILEECVLDALAGVAYLQNAGVNRLAIIGYSFGGAVAIQTAAVNSMTYTVITLATQSYGTSPIKFLPPTCSTLFIHGTQDEIVPMACSEYVYSQAHEPKRLMMCDGADHSLDFVAGTLYRVITDWLQNERVHKPAD